MSDMWGRIYDLRPPHNVRGGDIANLRVVRAFTTESLNKETITDCAPSAGSTKNRCPTLTLFRRIYDIGGFPIMIDQSKNGKCILWKICPEKLDYNHYLPLFFEGLRETEHPYVFFVRHGIRDLLTKGCEKVVGVVPQLIRPLRDALNTRCHPIMVAAIHAIQQLVLSNECVGKMLVPYYRQLLPIMSIFRNKNENLGDIIYYGQQRRENMGDLIQETLELLEKCGGEDAFVNIKYMIPNYESCILN